MSDLDKQMKRVADILGCISEVSEVSVSSLSAYLAYLNKNLEQPCYLTGTEDFSWEEKYVFGYGSKQEYEKLKKKHPSYTDIFELLSLEDIVDEGYGILAKLKRTTDKKKFTLPLADLESTDKKSKNYQLIDDFSVWFSNYR